nr:carbohydrate kinase [Lachnospiraceae bacterium]
CMEGITYEMYLNYRNVTAAGAKPVKLHATGGGAHSGVWMQMKADMLGLPITALRTVDAGTVGSAMLTGIATGLFRDIGEASDCMVEKTVTYQPRMNRHEEYLKMYEKYEKIYNAVREFM